MRPVIGFDLRFENSQNSRRILPQFFVLVGITSISRLKAS